MNKNIARIQKWLDRMSGACGEQKWASALIEADCLSAEVRKTREEILGVVRSAQAEKPTFQGRHRLFAVGRTASVAFAIVLAASLPLALEADRPWQPSVKTVYVQEDRLSWVTPEEESLLLSLRSEMSKGELITAGAAAKTQMKTQNRIVSKNTGGTIKKIAASGGAVMPSPDARAVDTVINGDLTALVQIGEKALRENSRAIKIIN